jgi:hypothetical protein
MKLEVVYCGGGIAPVYGGEDDDVLVVETRIASRYNRVRDQAQFDARTGIEPVLEIEQQCARAHDSRVH